MIINKTLAEGLAKRALRELADDMIKEEELKRSTSLFGAGYKKTKQNIKKMCAANSRCIFFEDRNEQKSSWQVIWGRWSLCSLGEPDTVSDLDRIAFNLHFSHKLVDSAGQFNIVLSKHALIRLLMRSGKDIKNGSDVLRFLKPMTRDIVWAGLSSLDGNAGSIIKAGKHYLPFASIESDQIILIKTVLRDD